MASRRRAPALLVWAVAVALTGVVTAAARHGDGNVAAGAASATSTTAVAAFPTTAPPATDAPAAATDGAAPVPADDAPAAADQPVEGPGGGGDGAAVGNAGAARTMPDPGTYTVSVQGTASLNGSAQPVPPTATYTIEQLDETDQHQTGDFDLTVRWSQGAASLVSLKIPQANKEFRADPPVLYTAFPGQPGDSWQWSLTSTDGKTTIDQTSTVTGREPVVVAGAAVDAFVVHTVIKLSGDLVGTVDLTSWVSDAYRLALKQHTVIDATFNLAFRQQSDTTSQLVSLTPT